MENNYVSVRDVWDFEKYYCSKPISWINTAHNLKSSYQVLFENSKLVISFDNNERDPLLKTPFWSAGTERMLIGFSLENMVKAILLLDKKVLDDAFKKEGKLSWGKDGHNLIKLYGQTNIELTPLEIRYLELWQICSLWAGRYPISINENHIPRNRKSLPSREALIQRSKKELEKAKKENDILMGADLNDLLNQGIGDLENTTFISLYDKSYSFIKNSCSLLPETDKLKCWLCKRIGCTK
ncbi:hypothetical protein SAMN02745127_02977 [Oceanospirillum multiglobuliferum]|uniref:Uncharacterized protein n=1 Tax=Oceanospirillum multiglobuliferum TaxID=64969 RepID=A0A1T4SDL3_9GAMM|nr:hypothetical protein [Oceanospirillum multiglobuliferum]OPX54320.1 hypothetical protein BTE48_14755 [Oceanospirillum multiglobuliferum]SKA26364.1 hypothetical protein SAMN02745127_02977 [Oceanospirillum multiglobuliferum]